jgi:hypothetical protein
VTQGNDQHQADTGRLAVTADLPTAVRETLDECLDALRRILGGRLDCVLLFGSAAEGRLRPTSDLNLLVMAQRFGETDLDALRQPLQSGRAAAGLTVMFLESAEFAAACEAFAMKFADIKVRHRILHGANPFDGIAISRTAEIRRLRQVLLNLALRLRERFALEGNRPERMAASLADMTGPVRVAAATLLGLRDGVDRAPAAALEEFCADPRWVACLEGLSAAHRGVALSAERTRALVADVRGLLAALAAAGATLT